MVEFIQASLTSVGNLVNSEKFLVSDMKCDTSEPDSPKVDNELFNCFKVKLKTFCKPFPILFL